MREGQIHTENRPEWMTIKVIPVIPPELDISSARRR